MALLFCDSFDHYDTACLYEKYLSSANAAIAASTGRNAGASPNNCLQLNYGGAVTKALPNSHVVIVGFALFLNRLAVAPSDIAVFNDNSTQQIQVYTTPAGALNFATGYGTFLGATAPGVIPANVWTYGEINIQFSTTATGTISVAINSETVLTLTDIQTAVSANNYANLVSLVQSDEEQLYIDDLYICDGTGTVNNSFLGDVRVALAMPNGDGRTNTWSQVGGTSGENYTSVDEIPPDDDASYVYSNTPGDIDVYTIASVGTVDAAVGVQLIASARKDDGGARVVSLGFGDGTSESYDSGTSLSNTYTFITRQLDINPLTGEAWAVADLSDAQIALNVLS